MSDYRVFCRFFFTIFPFCLFFRFSSIVSKQRKRLRSETFSLCRFPPLCRNFSRFPPLRPAFFLLFLFYCILFCRHVRPLRRHFPVLSPKVVTTKYTAAIPARGPAFPPFLQCPRYNSHFVYVCFLDEYTSYGYDKYMKIKAYQYLNGRRQRP